MTYKPRILIAEDDKNVAKYLTEMVSGIADYDVAETAPQAIEMFGRGVYDAVSMDGDLRGTKGSDAVVGIREIDSSVPIVVFSGRAEDTRRELEGVRIRNIEYFSKINNTPDEWYGAVRSALEHKRN